jgi:hypothetical protein
MQGVAFDGGRELIQLRQKDSLTGSLVGRLIDAVNRLATNVAASPIGELPAPVPIDVVTPSGTLSNNILTVNGEVLHFALTHNAPVDRGIRYVTEVDTNPNFTAPHVVLETTSRSGFIHLPASNSTGTLYNFYLRSTAQYQGSKPTRPTVYGGLQGATAIQMTGPSKVDLLPSQAAGTAKPGQGGQGLGAARSRGGVGGPKRLFNQ